MEAQRLHVGPVDPASEPDLAVRSTLGGLLGQLPFLRRDDAAPVRQVRVSGDADLARRLQTLARRFDPDWAQPLVSVFGPVLGVQIAAALRTTLLRLRETGSELAGSAAEFVTEESRDVVAKAELEAFHDEVDGLRDDVERLARACRAWRRAHEHGVAGDEERARRRARQQDRPRADPLPPGRAAGGHAGRRVAEAGPAVRAARPRRRGRAQPRRAPAPGAAGAGADLRQVRPDPLHPP